MANHARKGSDGAVIEVADDEALATHIPALRAEFVDCAADVLPGWVSKAGGGFQAPDPPAPTAPEPEPAPTSRLKPVGLFLASIPFAKLATIYAAKDTDAGVGAIMFVVGSLTEIDMMDAHTSAMLGYLEGKGYITAAEQTAILAA